MRSAGDMIGLHGLRDGGLTVYEDRLRTSLNADGERQLRLFPFYGQAWLTRNRDPPAVKSLIHRRGLIEA